MFKTVLQQCPVWQVSGVEVGQEIQFQLGFGVRGAGTQAIMPNEIVREFHQQPDFFCIESVCFAGVKGEGANGMFVMNQW
jgi:hypothetical protein